MVIVLLSHVIISSPVILVALDDYTILPQSETTLHLLLPSVLQAYICIEEVFPHKSKQRLPYLSFLPTLLD